MEIVFAWLLGLFGGAFIERHLSQTAITSAKNYGEQLLTGVETRVKAAIADVKAEVTKLNGTPKPTSTT